MSKLLSNLNHKIILALVLLTFALIASVVSAFYSDNSAYAMKIDDKVIGIVKDKNEAYKLLDDIKDDLKNQLDMKIKIPEKISEQRVFVSSNELTPVYKVKENIKKNISIQVEAYAITVNGKDLLFLKDELTAQQVLNMLKNEYLKSMDDTEIKEIEFIEQINIIKKDTSASNVMDLEKALEFILKGENAPEKYTVLEGDTIWDISIQKNISIDTIERLNPEIDIDKLQIGQQLNLSAPKPFINVQTVQISISEENIPYNVAYEETDKLYLGEKSIKKSGKNGKKNIQAEITKINGILTNMTIIKEEITQQPEDEVIVKGIKQRPRTSVTVSRSGVTRPQTNVPGGKFLWPTPGYYNITSPFGNRWHPILKKYKIHTGIDTSAPSGADVVAANDGKVVVSETHAAYGKRIIIDHGDGFSTMYAHNSSLLVKAGQEVKKGQVIAKVGSTGWSTGPHAHFEILVKGKPVDPMFYFR
ncbi:M23 family metallopeptidase [Petroclostridium sp. X23]|uniref:M23 family metallopeptidase n=1 Tax=Petroclostridium sp. X23 TaxID=3045146 RepID=UPI0024AE1EB6|nr:M23 family metallopeptidase [Petroclostridium sp. X23]WHH59985.1 M23 family metallopeptidase [Petroclostridium sp. X23]